MFSIIFYDLNLIILLFMWLFLFIIKFVTMIQDISHCVQLNRFPELTPRLKKRVVVGIRAYRRGGIRLELQKILNKNIVFNYGHGGAGVSLAPACGIEASQLATNCSPNKSVSILGAGIIGLFTALQCADRGLKVTVFADRVPKKNEKNVLEMCTSQIAPGYWLPYNYQYSDVKLHNFRRELSFKKYGEWMKKSKNIYEVECYQQMKPQVFKNSAPDFIFQKSKVIPIKVGNKQFTVVNFKTMQIHLQNFLQQLIQQCTKKGVQFVSSKFNSLNDVLRIKDQTIIACLGLSSKYLFNDNDVYGVKGHLVELENTTQMRGIFGFNFQGQFALYCFKDKVLIGLSRESSQALTINQETVKMLENRAYNFYKYVGLDFKPKL